jgi:thioredoxin-like negative regulator of GroEL
MTKIKLLARTKFEFLIELLVVIVILAILAVLLFPAIRGTQLTEETQADLKNIRQLLFDMDFDKAVQAAEVIRQKAGREFAYFEIVYRLAEAERFDEAQKYVSKVGWSYTHPHQPPLARIIQSRLVETLAAAGRFDEAEQALKKAAYQTLTTSIVSIFLINANRLDDAIRLLDEYPEDDFSIKIRRSVITQLIKNGDDQKALEIAGAIQLDGWRNGSYREIIREQLKQDRYQDAVQTFSHIDILRYKQQAVMIFVAYLLEKGRSDEARQLAERFKSPDQATAQNIQNAKTDNDPFATTPDEWNKYADDKNKDKRPFLSYRWQKIIDNIFTSFDQLDQLDTKTTSSSESDDSVSDAKRKVLPADFDTSRLLQTYGRRYYQRYSLGVSQSDDMPLNYHIHFPSDWNEKLYSLWNAQISVGQLDEALLTMQKLHVTDPKGCSEARRVIAEALFKAERIDEAKEQASLALKFAERAGNYNLDLVGTLFKIGQVAEAKLVLSKIEIPSTLDYDDSASWFKSPVDVKIERQKIEHWREILEKKE